MVHVFIIGSKGIPARYGGFETFVDELVSRRASSDIKYHVACAVDEMPEEREFEYRGAHCFRVQWRPIGSARAMFYDLEALDWAIEYAARQGMASPVFYVLACRIGPFIASRAKRIHELGGCLLVNPDGHEWKRSKWNSAVRGYWKLSEAGMVRHADLLVCDSQAIERYIQQEYAKFNPATVYIPYGAEVPAPDGIEPPSYTEWLATHDLSAKGYYLVVGRFVPENNYETIIREFMASKTDRQLVFVTDAEGPFLEQLAAETGFAADSRIRFVGTVYDRDLLTAIRSNAFAYIHGHEVGGTNPSLLEALAATDVNLLLDVSFNREVARESALYWVKEPGSLAALVNAADALGSTARAEFAESSSHEMETRYLWSLVTELYEWLFIELTTGSATEQLA